MSTRLDISSPEQSKNVLQFTEEKEAFISEEEIAKYMKRGKGKYYCKICCCRAMKKGAVLHHLVNKHNVHSPYKCTICGKAFLYSSFLSLRKRFCFLGWLVICLLAWLVAASFINLTGKIMAVDELRWGLIMK